MNFRIFWDGDLYDELLDGIKIDGWNGSGMSRLFTASDCSSVNGSKANPALQADLFGDWREEVVYPLSTNDGLRVYTTNIETKYKIKTLMSDRMYRNSVASEQASYNQPPNISMYLSNDTVYGNITNVSLTAPIRKTYIKGQSLDLRGMTLTGTFDTGLSAELEEYEVSGFDSSTAGKKTVTVTSHGYTFSFDVNVVDGANFYSDNFSSYSSSSITMGRQGTEAKSQALGSLNLGIGAKGDYTSGFAISNYTFGNVLSCVSGRYATVGRGAYFNFDQCNLPAFADLGNDEILTIDFDARYQDSSSTMEIRGVTSTGSEKANSSNPFRDPYLSVLNNSNIPTGEWINVKLDITKSKNVTLTITGKGGNVLDTRTFTAKGDAVGNIAFYGSPSQIDISNMSVYTNDVVNGISIASEPTKTEYEKGSTELDLTGLVVNAT